MRALAFLLALIAAPMALAQAPLDPALVARAEAGDALAAEDLAIAYAEQQDFASARRWALFAARAGRAEAMNQYASLLRHGDPPNEAEANLWEERAIEAGSPFALLNRASRLIWSEGDEAWLAGYAALQRAEHPQISAALNDIALQYEDLAHARDDRLRSLTQLAAERGSPEAQWRYAMQLRQGVGGARNLPEAYLWTRRSGEAGYLDGQISTAVMLATAEGVAEDDVQARSWYERAASQGSAHALRSLGGMLFIGEGGDVDQARGWAYILIAAEAGDELASDIVRDHGARIPGDVREAAELIRADWLSVRGMPRAP